MRIVTLAALVAASCGAAAEDTRSPDGAMPAGDVAAAAAVAGSETLRLRISGQGSEELDICDAQGRCPVAHEREEWSIAVSREGSVVEGFRSVQGWAPREDDDRGGACSVNGEYRGRYQLTHIAWWTPEQAEAHGLFAAEGGSAPGRLFVIGATPLPDRSTEPSTSGSCPREVQNTGARPYDDLAEYLTDTRFFVAFLPAASGSPMKSISSELDGVIREYRLEVLEGDIEDLQRYARREN